MNSDTDNKETIYAYLLGSLAEAEAERFDEMTVVDQDFADAVSAAEKDLVDSYVHGELSGAELERFESHYLASPLRRSKVGFARAFQAFAEKDLASEAPAAVLADDTTNRQIGLFSWLKIFSGPQMAFRFAVAAAALILVGVGGWVVVRNLITGRVSDETASVTNKNTIESVKQATPHVEPSPAVTQTPANGNASSENARQIPTKEKKTTPKPETEPPTPRLAIASFVLLPPLRGGGKLEQITIEPRTDIAAFKLALDADDYKAYRVELRDPDSGRSYWKSGRIRSKGKDGNSALNVRIPAKLFGQQIYTLSVSGISADGAVEKVGDYTFHVVR